MRWPDRNSRNEVFARYDEMHRLLREPDGTVALYLGTENWPFPIPLVEKNNAWYFDTAVGKQEILYRRIGRNELATIDVCLAVVDAQKQYASDSHDGEAAGQYAQKLVSDPEQRTIRRPFAGGDARLVVATEVLA